MLQKEHFLISTSPKVMVRIYHYLTALLAFFPFLLFAQMPTDAVHLLSGQTYEGIVIEQRPGISIQLWHLPQGDTLIFTMDEIERITRILPSFVPSATTDSLTPALLTVPFHRNVVMVHACIGGGDYPFGGLGLTLSRRLGQQGKTWVGFDARYIGNTATGGNDFGIDAIQNFPLLADLRQEFRRSKNGRFSILVFVEVGYVISITGNSVDQYGEIKYGNGWAFHPGIAFKINLSRNAGLMLDLGWMHHTGSRHWLPPATVPDDVKTWNNGLVRGSIFF